MKKILEVKDLRVHFYTYNGTVKAVDGVSFEVYEGEVLCIVGETGCGKSVTARAITKMIRSPGKIVGGRVLFNGIDILELDEDQLSSIRGKTITYVYQDPSAALDPLYTAGYHVAETVTAHSVGMRIREALRRAVEIFHEILIPDPENRVKSYPHELSGGMKQRVVIATAVANYPKLIIADEPTTALDVTIQAQILDLLKELKGRYGSSVVMITHNLGVVAEMCDRVIVMYAGKIVEKAHTERLFENPLHPYTKGLLNAVPNPYRKTMRLESIPGVVPDMINVPEGCRFRPRCPFATNACLIEPELIEAEKDHYVSCWLTSKVGQQ
ncbi:MAG: ABC transporter ATP-binding protein [Ignisphaera sp.]|nr:ABC transporter ATP-binding protein [Ignisphaera sp.]MCX8167689.1 ABC transporter ATP-binding protein [Ignisphaera sp.]MDW8085679.1 ABC transporter ATP-binding protein [Ignisphaera sp.]